MATTTTRLERVINALEQRMAESDCGIADLTMKVNGDKVTVEPWINGLYSVYFSTYGRIAYAKTIEELATWMIEYPKKADELLKAEMEWREENIPKLKEFFNTHIKGHTEAEYEIGSDFSHAIYKSIHEKAPQELKDKSEGYIFNKVFDDFYVAEYRKTHPQFSKDTLLNALQLVTDCGCYSDWYKDCYGHRPSYLLD